MKEDLKQYITNLLYYAHGESHIFNSTQFDEWVNEMIEGLDEYFKAPPMDLFVEQFLTDDDLEEEEYHEIHDDINEARRNGEIE